MSDNNFRRVEDRWDDDGLLVPGYAAWDCTAVAYRKRCGAEVRRYRGESDVSCPTCGAFYNAGGQRLRDDFRGNPSMYDDNVGDMEGFEVQQLRREAGL